MSGKRSRIRFGAFFLLVRYSFVTFSNSDRQSQAQFRLVPVADTSDNQALAADQPDRSSPMKDLNLLNRS
jgi:hypothetical protein